MREKLATHVKEIGEKKTLRGKESTFHRLSPSITSTLASQHVPLSLSLIQDLQEMKNTREEEEEKLHYTTLNYKMKMKLLLKLCISPTLESRGYL